MKIEIKRSKKPVNYIKAINKLEKRVNQIIDKKIDKELIWFLEHPSIFTAGQRSIDKEILDKNIKIIKTSRGGKITWHGPGQLICYFVINLNNRKKDIRNFINLIEKSIIETLDEYKIKSKSDRKNVGIWIKKKNSYKKIAAIGIRVRRWIAYHGFAININNDLKNYNKILPCGIKNRSVTNLNKIKKNNYKNLSYKLEKNILKNFKI